MVHNLVLVVRVDQSLFELYQIVIFVLESIVRKRKGVVLEFVGVYGNVRIVLFLE